MPYIYVLLTRTGTLPARLIRLFTHERFSHSSIALDIELTTLCSFARKHESFPLPAGLVRESPQSGYLSSHGDTLCALLELEVTEAIYESAKKEIATMLGDPDKYHYNIAGLGKCFFGVAEERPGYYFCSQFVSMILQKSGALHLPKPPSLMHPFDFERMPELRSLFEGRICELASRLRKIAKENIAFPGGLRNAFLLAGSAPALSR